MRFLVSALFGKSNSKINELDVFMRRLDRIAAERTRPVAPGRLILRGTDPVTGRPPEVLRQLEALALVVRGDAGAVEGRGRGRHPLVDEPAHDLPVFEDEGRLVATDLEHAARSRAARLGPAETGVEEARVMHAELPHHRHVGRHLGRVGRRDRHRLAADEDVEGAGIEDDPAVHRVDLLPEVGGVVVADPVEIDDAGVGLGAVADEAALGGPRSTEKPRPSSITGSPRPRRGR
jgi:hypothetical protein